MRLRFLNDRIEKIEIAFGIGYIDQAGLNYSGFETTDIFG